MKRHIVPAVLTIAGIGLLLAGCGAAETPASAAGAIRVEATDSACHLASATAAAGAISFEVTNKGSQVTEFYLYGADGRVISEVENVSPGLTRTMTANVTAPGTYTTACKPGMQGEGIRGAFTVTAAQAVAPPAVPQGVVSQYTVLEQEIADAGGSTTTGPWRVAYIVEAAEPWYHGVGAQQHYREPAPGETHHIEIIPIESATGRIVPDVPIQLEVVDSAGAVVDSKSLNFYYSEFFHYANNFSVPQEGTYTLRARLDAPTFLRHGEATEPPALGEGAQVTFTGVELKHGH